MTRPTVKHAYELYIRNAIFSISDVMELFNISRSTAYRLVKTYLPPRYRMYGMVNKDALYDAFGMSFEKLKNAYKAKEEQESEKRVL